MTVIKPDSKPLPVGKRSQTSEAQRSMIITLHEEGYPLNKIAERTGIPKSTCFSIVKFDKQHREAGAKTTYTKNAAKNGLSIETY